MKNFFAKAYEILLSGWMNTSGILIVIIMAIPAIASMIGRPAEEVLQYFLMSIFFIGGLIIGNGLRITSGKEINGGMAAVIFFGLFALWMLLSVLFLGVLKLPKVYASAMTYLLISLLGLGGGIVFGFLKPPTVAPPPAKK